MKRKYEARLANKESDYQHLGIARGDIAPFEDGVRTTGKFGEYEWWYFDAKLEDGSSLVIIFYTAPVTACSFGYSPAISFSYTAKDGTFTSESKSFKKSEATYDREGCNIRIAENTFSGDLHSYTITYQSEKIKAKVTLESNCAPWRPETGHILFGKEKYFAWLPSVPEGNVAAELEIGDKQYHLTGTGYHDHNWGNTGMFYLMHHWYWGRAKIGDYQVITSYITANEKHGYEHFPIFCLSKNGKRLAEDGSYVRYTQTDTAFDPITKKHYHKTLSYDYEKDGSRYRITYRAEDIIEYFSLDTRDDNAAAKCPKALVWLVRAIGLSPSYIRLCGTATLEHFENGELLETVSSPAIWEQMYFGKDADV